MTYGGVNLGWKCREKTAAAVCACNAVVSIALHIPCTVWQCTARPAQGAPVLPGNA